MTDGITGNVFQLGWLKILTPKAMRNFGHTMMQFGFGERYFFISANTHREELKLALNEGMYDFGQKRTLKRPAMLSGKSFETCINERLLGIKTRRMGFQSRFLQYKCFT